MKKKGKKPIIKSRVIIEGNAENSFMKNKLPKIIHDLEKFTKRELRVILSPSLNVSTTNIFKNFEPLPKETPRKNLKNLVSSTPYCGRYINTQFTANSSLPSPIHLGSFNRIRCKGDNRKDTNLSSESSSVVYIGTEVNNSLKTRKSVKEEPKPEDPKSRNLLEVQGSVETSVREQFKRNEVHTQSKSPNNKESSVEASFGEHKSQDRAKEQDLVNQSAQTNVRDASFSKSSNNKKKAEASLKSIIGTTKHKDSPKGHIQSSKVGKLREEQFDASDQDSLKTVETARSQHCQPKIDKRNVSTANNSRGRVTGIEYRSATRLAKEDAKNQSHKQEGDSTPSKINKSSSRLLKSGKPNGTSRAAGEPKDFGRSGKTNLESNKMVDKPTEVQCRTVQVNTEVPSPLNHDMSDSSTLRRSSKLAEGDAGKQSDKEESSIMSLKNGESRSRYVTSRCKRPDDTFRAAKEPDDFRSIREINLEPKQMVDKLIEGKPKTVQANTRTSSPSKRYMSAGKRRNQSGLFKGSFKDVLMEMERQARLKFTASVPAWTQTSGLTLGDNANSDNDAMGLEAHIIHEITTKKSQRMCNIKEQNSIMSEAAKAKSKTAIGPEIDESRAAESVCKKPLLNGAKQLNRERNSDHSFISSLRKERAKVNQERLRSFENLINRLEANALAAQENGENSDSAISFNSSISSNRRFKLPEKFPLNADENLRFSRCNSRHNKSVTSKKENLNSTIEKLAKKSAARQNVAKKSTQTSCLGAELLQVTPADRKPGDVAPLFRRSTIKRSCERLKNLRVKKKSSVSNWKNSTEQSVSSPIPNIYDSIREGNVADCLNFSALSDACFAEYVHKPWRCPEISSHTDTFPRLSFIRPEAAIAADVLHKFDNDSDDDESSDFDGNRSPTNNNVSLAPSNVSASKGKPHCRRYSKYKARNTQSRKSGSCKKTPLSVWKVQNKLDDGIETEVNGKRNVSAEIKRNAKNCSLMRQQDVPETQRDEAVDQILRPSTRNTAANSEGAESWIRDVTVDGVNNTLDGTRTSKSPIRTRVNAAAPTPKYGNVKKRRESKKKGNRDATPISPQQTPQKTNEENDRRSSTRLISDGKHNVSLHLPGKKSKMETPSSSIVRSQSCSVAEDDNLQSATSKKGRRKRNTKNSTVENSFLKKKTYNTNYPLADISEINIIPSNGMDRPKRARKTKTFAMPEELEKNGFVFSHEKRRSRARSSTQKTKKRASKKSSIQEDQRVPLQETNMEGALPPIEENDVNEDAVPGSIEANENRFNEMPPPRTVPRKRKTLAVKNGEVSIDSGFETSNTGRKTGKTSRGCMKRKIVSSDVARSSDSERDFRVSGRESNALSRISSPIHNTPYSPEPDESSARTDEIQTKRLLRTEKKCPADSPLGKYKKFGDAYIYKLYNTPDKKCEVGYLRIECGEETGCFVFGDYSSVALSVKLGTSFVKIEDKSFAAKIDDWFHVLKGQKYIIRNTSRDQYLKLIYMKLR
ncbi:uncharacterized protein [Euwallacea fornicatus]|uniref:uncharacterized protein isoform X2 n=1 Tax=Euwallacea fornicatus TaxID=995702 RepID=UPI00338E5EA1